MPRARKYPQELIDRGVRLAIESGRPVAHVAADIGLPAETLRKKVRQAEADRGLRPDLPSTAEREEIKELNRENAELRQADEMLRAASLFFAKELDGSRPRGARSSMCSAAVSALSSSAAPLGCRPRRTISARPAGAHSGPWRMSGWPVRSAGCMRPTMRPMGIGGCTGSWCVRARRPGVTTSPG